MKRLLLIVLVLAFAAPAFADDALVLPQGVWRTRVIPAFQFAGSEFGSDFGVDRDSRDDVRALALGFAVEYGINDWINLAMQWTPAFSVWSDIDLGAPLDQVDVTVNRWADIFAGAKVQVIGPQAPVSRNDMRLALATGVKIPLSSADWEKEAENQGNGKDFVATNIDRNVLGLGARFYYDYVFSPSFFVNLYSEFIWYPNEGEAPNLTAYRGANSGLAGPDVTEKFDYGYDFTIEVDPQFIYTASPGLRINPSMPIRFTYSPEVKLDGKRISEYTWPTAGPAAALGVLNDEGPSAVLAIEPTVEFFFTGLTVPTALQVAYRYPIAGQNANATNVLIIQVKNFLKFW